uniref:Uncharacterized protein n=1 Tax=Anguilla anguilla TaxID=7936 RepID=A0A0E9TK85_ANGAN
MADCAKNFSLMKTAKGCSSVWFLARLQILISLTQKGKAF